MKKRVGKFRKIVQRFKPFLLQRLRGISICRREIRYKIIIGVLLVFLITLMFPRGKSYQFADFKEGSISTEEVIAPFTFNVNKSEEELARDREEARQKVLPVFIRDDSIAQSQIEQLRKFFITVNKAQRNRLADSLKIAALKDSLKEFTIVTVISDKDLEFLLKDAQSLKKSRKQSSTSFQELLLKITRDLFSIGIVDEGKKSFAEDAKILVKKGNQELKEDLKHYSDLEEAKEKVLQKLSNNFSSVEDTVKVGYDVVTAFLKPNVKYDKDKTQRRIDEAIAAVPLVKGTVLKGERIIDSHQRVTKEHLDKLQSLTKAKAEREAMRGGVATLLPYVGKIFFIIMSLSFPAIFLYFFRPSIFWDDKMLLLIAITMLLIIFAAYLIESNGLSEYLLPIAVASMLMAIIFDTRTAFIITVSLCLLFGGMRGNEFNISVISLFVGTASIVAVSLFRRRSKFIGSVSFIIPVYVISITALAFLQYVPIQTVMKDWLYGSINGILSPIFTYGLLMFFESIFGVTTDMSLLELSDLNRKLLKNLAVIAPGTYHHSILVSNLSEAAAEAIGANSLLAKVGSYYHDIGKMEMPEYFVENQKGGRNPHEKLGPGMSCLILINHVRRGLELAEENKLPPVVKDFIAQHHGTSLMAYFYQKAKEKNGGKEINEADFRYPGPKPQTKETGIVMLADAVEAAARTLRDPKAGRIRALVNSILDGRFRDSELDECPLTLKDLNKIAESFQTILMGVIHSRIEYPDQEAKFFKKNDKRIKERVHQG